MGVQCTITNYQFTAKSDIKNLEKWIAFGKVNTFMTHSRHFWSLSNPIYPLHISKSLLQFSCYLGPVHNKNNDTDLT